MLLQLQVRGNPIYGKEIVLAIRMLKDKREYCSNIGYEKKVGVLQNQPLSVISALSISCSLLILHVGFHSYA